MSRKLFFLEPHFETRIAGIPCIVEVTYYYSDPGCSYTWDSPADYYGYTEIEWNVRDRKGYPAKWLERKITDEIRSKIDSEAIEHLSPY